MASLERIPQRADRAQRLLQLETIARRGTQASDSARQPLEVANPPQRVGDFAAEIGFEQLLDRVVARADGVEVEQRVDDPVLQRARADRRERLVEHREQRAAARAVGRNHQFQMAPADLVDQHVFGGAIKMRRAQMRQFAAEGFFDVDQGGASHDTEGLAKRAGRLGPEPRGQRLALTPRGEARAVEPGNRGIDALEQRGERGVALGRDNFARRDPRDLLAHSGWPGDSSREKLSGRNVERRQRETALAGAVGAEREQKTLFECREHGLLADRARRDHAHDLPRHQAALWRQLKRRVRPRDLTGSGSYTRARLGLRLLADRDLQSGLEQLGDIGFGGMVRHAAQRHAVLGARGELDIEHARADLGVLEQHLVEVAEAKEQDRVGHLLLDAQVLCDQR